MKEVLETLPLKTDLAEAQKLWNYFDDVCTYQDLKDLYQKVLPPLSAYETKMEEMSRDYE